MVEHKVRVFYEPDSNSIGAEVKIYSETGENIDNILITTESKWKELDDKINSIDEEYIDHDELRDIVNNASGELVMNATYLNGLSSNQFALANHTHDTFAPRNHMSSNDDYGLGNQNQYGHVKTINNCNSSIYLAGEALSAHQGKILQDTINDLKKEILSWEKKSCTDYGTLWINKSLRLCNLKYYRENFYPSETGNIILHQPESLSNYSPVTTTSVPISYTSIYSSFSVTYDGILKVYAEKKGTRANITANLLWRY